MRICAHFNKQTKQCNLGISPVQCSGCSMFALGSRRSINQTPPNDNPIVLSDRAEVQSNVTNVIDESQPPQLQSPESESSVNEQNIIQTAAVSGGCGCRKR